MERRRSTPKKIEEAPPVATPPVVEKPPTRGRATPKRTHYIVANHHTAAIVFPRQSPGSGGHLQKTKPLVLPSGHTEVVAADEWNVLRKNPVVQRYIDAHLISEVEREGDIPASAERTSSPPIPDHLKTEQELGARTGHSAGVVRSDANTITVS